MDRAKYLARINYTASIEPTDDVLVSLHKSHVFQVPFENLDTYYQRLFDLNIQNIYNKVITHARGGFCYELNLLFNWLLTDIGFASRIIASRIFNEHGILGPPFDHMCIYVKTDKEFLVDVGFGDLFITPLEIKSGEQYDGRNYFKIDKWNETEFLLSMSANGIDYARRYTLSLDDVKAAAFNDACFDKQTNATSYFVRNVIGSKPTTTGRVTVFNNKLIETNGLKKLETPIEGDARLRMLLKEKFDVVIR